MVTDIITPFLFWIIQSFEEGASMPEVVTYPIGFIILLFASLIYNEIIILNFCGLSKNTNKFVKQRIKKEISELNVFLDDHGMDKDSDEENEIKDEQIE